MHIKPRSFQGMTLSPGSALHLYDLLELFHGPFFQLPDLSHGFIEAGHLGRQFILFLGELRGQKETDDTVWPGPHLSWPCSLLPGPPPLTLLALRAPLELASISSVSI